MGVKLSNRDYLWSYIGVILSLGSNLLMVPFIMYYLDGDHYGLWGVYQSLAGITVLFDFGFTTTFSRNINYCWNGAERLEKTEGVFSKSNEPNYYLMKKTMTACQWIFLIISGVALLLMATVGTAYVRHISASLGTYEPVIAWIICAVAIFLNLYYGYYGAFLRGVGAIQDVNKAMVYARLTQLIATIGFLVIGFGLIGTSIAYLLYGALFRFIAKCKFYSYRGIGDGLKNISAKFSLIEFKEIFLTVWYNAWREGLVSLSTYLAGQASTIIVSLYMPLTQTGAYSLGMQISMAVAQIAMSMYRSNQPVLQSAYINNDKDAQRRTMSLIVVSFVSMHIIGMILITVFGLPLLRFIRPETVVGAPVLIGLGFYQLILNFRNCYGSYFSCTNRIPYVTAYIISAIVGVVLSFVAMGEFNLGMWGIIGAQIISQGIYNGWIWTYRAHKEMELSAGEMINLGYDEIMKIVRSIMWKFRRENA